jgi:hypothetical protein
MRSLQHVIPAVFQYRDFAAAGGLIAYGGNFTDSHRRAGVYTGRVLEGEKPAVLPVQQVTKIELIVNLKAAKALGLAIPATLPNTSPPPCGSMLRHDMNRLSWVRVLRWKLVLPEPALPPDHAHRDIDGARHDTDCPHHFRTGLCGNATGLWTTPDLDFGYWKITERRLAPNSAAFGTRLPNFPARDWALGR